MFSCCKGMPVCLLKHRSFWVFSQFGGDSFHERIFYMNMNIVAAVAGSLVVGAAAFVPMGAAVSPDPLQAQAETSEETLATEPAVTDESPDTTVEAAAAPLVVPSFARGDDDDDDEDDEDHEDEDDEDEDDEDGDDEDEDEDDD
jgi:hypothetical protein